jgi:hypothetical protein
MHTVCRDAACKAKPLGQRVVKVVKAERTTQNDPSILVQPSEHELQHLTAHIVEEDVEISELLEI